MAVHTYVLNPFTVAQQTDADVQWQSTGTADGLAFVVYFWQSAVMGFSQPQLKAYLKSLIDAQLFPVAPQPAGPLVTFNGGTFTG